MDLVIKSNDDTNDDKMALFNNEKKTNRIIQNPTGGAVLDFEQKSDNEQLEKMNEINNFENNDIQLIDASIKA